MSDDKARGEKLIRALQERLDRALARRDAFAQSGNMEAAQNVDGFIEWCHDRIGTLEERYRIKAEVTP